MSVEFFFLGLSQTGASISMALAEAELELTRIGFDPDIQQARRAREAGAVDKLASHPRNAPKTADVVVLDIPPTDMRDYLEMLGKILKPGGVVVDTSPLKTMAISLAAECLSDDHHYIGATPIVGPEALLQKTADPEAPHADLFRGGIMAIVVPQETPKETTALALNLAHFIGATPMFIDPVELDGLNATTEELPRLLGLALMRMASSSPGWNEAQRIAGTTFAAATMLGTSRPPDILGSTLSINKENILPKLDALIEELRVLYNLIAEDNDDALMNYLTETAAARDSWLSNRIKGEWEKQGTVPLELPRKGEFFKRLVGIRPPKSKDRQ